MATVPVMDSFTAGEKVTAAKLNKNIRDAGNFFRNPPACGVTRVGGTASIPNATFTQFQFDTALHDTDAMWSPTFFGIVAKTPGIYRISAQITWGPVSGGYRLMEIIGNSGQTVQRTETQSTSANNLVQQVNWVGRVTQDTPVRVFVTHNAGGTIGIYGTSTTCHLAMEWVAP